MTDTTAAATFKLVLGTCISSNRALLNTDIFCASSLTLYANDLMQNRGGFQLHAHLSRLFCAIHLKP